MLQNETSVMDDNFDSVQQVYKKTSFDISIFHVICLWPEMLLNYQ